jgi:hypothetical protein
MMSELSPTSSADKGETAIDLAVLVSQRVEIETIVLAESKSFRSPSIDHTGGEEGLEFQVVNVAYGKDQDRNQLFIIPSFKVFSVEGEERKPNEKILIEATFALIYSVTSFDGIEDRHIEAFGSINGIFNAWPYWREFVQNTSVRMGLPAVTAPVYRVTGR